MSGILGLFRTDGAPIDPGMIRALTAHLAPRGPDGQAVWCDGPTAFGHTLLSTGRGASLDRQPLTLDGQTWIVADARVDARRELVTALGSDEALGSASDAELILRAYAKWGDACATRLVGDYAFAIWDSRGQRLFCARDHMGVKPLFYVYRGGWLLVSNALSCLRAHPAVSGCLDDLAIADFLLFGFSQDPAATAFRDIRRVPAAHTLSCSAAELRLRRYWTMPIDEPIYYPDDRDYLERFGELLRTAVSDRLRTERVGVLMSGGIDSTALAATAASLLSSPTVPGPVRAFTCVHESLIRDADRDYAALAADGIGIPIHYYVTDQMPGWPHAAAANSPEPLSTVSDWQPERRCYSEMARHSPVAFYGEGPDNALLYEWRPHLAHLWRQRRWGRMLADVGKHLVHHKRVPLLPTIPRMLRDWLDRKRDAAVFPQWMAPALIDRWRLDDRWRDFNSELTSPHPVRPRAYASLGSPLWQRMFETLEPCYTGAPLEVRHPYVDVRLLRFLLSVPAMPWCRHKHLVRCALRGVIPEAVRRRPKSPLSGHPDHERVARYGLPALRLNDRLATYGSASAWAEAPGRSVDEVETALRFAALSQWLDGLDSPPPQSECASKSA